MLWIRADKSVQNPKVVGAKRGVNPKIHNCMSIRKWGNAKGSVSALQEVEARLRQKVATVNPDLSLPQEIAKRVSAAPGSAAAYGQHKQGDTASKVTTTPISLLSIQSPCLALQREAGLGAKRP